VALGVGLCVCVWGGGDCVGGEGADSVAIAVEGA
jgi:hypothetical protein